jgi:predicted house-cleaning noncanonical NTP pyrophosphatase (MazG superfamily)
MLWDGLSRMAFKLGKQSKLKRIRARYFTILNALQKIIFSGYIQRDYLVHQDRYEEKIQQLRNKLFRVMKEFRSQENLNSLAQFENLYEIIFSLTVLKLRVVDPAIFEVCEKEMYQLSQCVAHILSEVERSDNKIAMDNLFLKLAAAVEAFEEIYRTTLQIVSYEPMVFLFFLQTLIALQNTLRVLVHDE